MKIQCLALILVVFGNVLVEEFVFVSEDFFLGPKIYDRAMMARVHYFLLEGITFKEVRLLVLS
jgi:hypothetical protein